MKYTRAIVRTPGKSLVQGISTAGLGKPDFSLARSQHQVYIQALVDCGLQVRVLEAMEDFPDSTFIEDVALVTPHCAVQLSPGAPSRKGEEAGIDRILAEYYRNVHAIHVPGTVEGGDILQVGDHYFIGLTERTNPAGAAQLAGILQDYGFTASTVAVEDMLHLKTGLAWLDGRLLAASGALRQQDVFKEFPVLPVEPEEAYAANCLHLNGRVLLPAGFPHTEQMLRDEGFPVITVDVSEFRKLDGGVSCLSLRF